MLHASYRVSARQARDRGDRDQAAALDARADEIEAALMTSAREAVAWLERHAAYTRTGQGRVSAIEHAKPGTTELRTLAAYVEALGGRLEIIADFGDQRLAFIEPGTEAV